MIVSEKNTGIGKLSLVSKIGLSKTVVTKLIRDLDKKGLISKFKTKGKQRLIYMGSEYLPDEGLTGGLLYKDGQIDCEKIQAFRNSIVDII